MNSDVKAVFSLYRTCLRQIRRLPTDYLRQFFRLKVGDDVRAVLDPRLQHLRPTKLARVHKSLRKLEHANHGHVHAFQYILETAYGRRGQLKWEILEPLKVEPGAELPPRIIRSVESSRPPVWSKEVQALVTSDVSRTTKALSPASMTLPPKLPADRLDPSSSTYGILGRLSKRREVNARWRYFTEELRKTYYPLQTTLVEQDQSGEVIAHKTDEASLARAGIRGIGLQGSGVFEEVETLACPPSLRALENGSEEGDTERPKQGVRPRFDSRMPRRFLRRRYQQLLAKIPVLEYKVPAGVGSTGTSSDALPGRYQVALSLKAAMQRGSVHAVMDSTDLAWIEHAKPLEPEQGKGKRRSR